MIVSLFHCTPDLIRPLTLDGKPNPQYVPGLGTRLRAAGVRHLEMAAMSAPAEVPWCKANGWRLIVVGDGFMRTAGDRRRNCTREQVSPVAHLLGESGICDGIEMVDETKQDPAVYAPYAKLFYHWWAGPPVAWPGHQPQRFEVPELSDYISRQFRWDTPGITQKQRMERLRGSLIDAPHDGRDICAMIPTVEAYYKRVPGTEFNRGDELVCRMPKPRDIDEMVDCALNMGANRLRFYAVDTPHWFAERLNTKPGSKALMQTGMGQSHKGWPRFLETLRRILKGVTT